MSEAYKSISEIPDEGFVISTSELDQLKERAQVEVTAVKHPVVGNEQLTTYSALPLNELMRIASNKEAVFVLLDLITQQLAHIGNPQDSLDAIQSHLGRVRDGKQDISILSIKKMLDKAITTTQTSDRQVLSIIPFLSEFPKLIELKYSGDQKIIEALTALQKRVTTLQSYPNQQQVLAEVQRVRNELNITD